MPRPTTRLLRIFLAAATYGVILNGASPGSAHQFDHANELGLSLGTPAGLNAEYLHEFGNRALYISGGYWGAINGIQVGVSAVRTGTSRKHFSLNIVTGHISTEGRGGPVRAIWTYGAAEFYFRLRRVFIAPVISAGDGHNDGGFSYSSPQMLVRLGFTWKV